MGADHARILAQDVPGAAVQVICDMSLARAQEVGNATGALDVSDDPFATIRRADVDAVLIASPDQTHPAFVLASLAADKPMPLPAYDQCMKASHAFNLLDARGVISVTERQAYIGRVRALAKACCEKWVATSTAWKADWETKKQERRTHG